MNNSTIVRSGFSARRLDVLTARMQAAIDAGQIPGVAMLIARDGEVAYEAVLGHLGPLAGTPMPNDAIFRIYSMTKPIVSVAAMMLAEEGALLLSDPISKYLPEFGRMQVGVEAVDEAGKRRLELAPAARPITIHDLLRHTSGLTYGRFGDSLVKQAYRDADIGNDNASSDNFIAGLARMPLAYQPATTWEYSHSTDVLGVLLERITGVTLDVLLAQRILQPLGMRDTGFRVPAADLHRVAQPFAVDPVTGAAVRLRRVEARPGFLSGGGGMVSTARDYLRFCRMLLNGGELDGARILSRKTVACMTSDHLGELPAAKAGASYLPGAGYGFGLGFAVRTSAGDSFMPGSVGDYTWSGVAGTYFWIDPRERMIAIFLMQAPEQRHQFRQLYRNLVYAALE